MTEELIAIQINGECQAPRCSTMNPSTYLSKLKRNFGEKSAAILVKSILDFLNTTRSYGNNGFISATYYSKNFNNKTVFTTNSRLMDSER